MFNGMWALYARETKRFQKIWIDTVFSPIVSIALYLGVFGVVGSGRNIGDLPYITFVYAGLLTMIVINSSFSNPSFALVIAKNLGSIVDLQLVPIAPWRIGIAYALAALTRGALTLIVTVLCTVWFIPHLGIPHPLYLLLVLLLTGIEFGMLGVMVGFMAKTFDALTFMSAFVMQPMIFLAGVFYPVSTLPHPWSLVSRFNPVYHNINLARYALTNYQDTTPVVSFLVIVGITMVLFVVMQLVARKNTRV